MKKIITALALFAISCGAWAQPKAGYYAAAKGQSGYALKTSLFNIVGPHKDLGY
ncbi:MAG: hypothetical protein HUK09_09550, partial [Bacteroidaceae bacterium]|nr:hypothetical protein [Bacteroidaceae bacterium]